MKQEFSEIPAPYKIDALLHQKTYLVNGQLKNWTGATSEVHLPFRLLKNTNQLC